MRSFFNSIKGSRFARDSTVLQAGSMLLAGSGLLATLALSHILGATKLGEYYLGIAAFTALWFALNLGVFTVAISKVAAASERRDLDEVRDWLAFALEATLITGTLCVLLSFYVLPDILDMWLGGDAAHAERVALYAMLLALEPLIGLPRLLSSVALQGQRRMASLTRMENAQELTRAFLVILGAFWTGSVLGAVIGQLIAACLGIGIALYFYGKERRIGNELPSVWSVFRKVGRVRIRGRWGVGIRMGLVRNIDAYALTVMPFLILDRYGSTKWVAYLRIAQRLVGVVRLFMAGVGKTGFVALSQAGGNQDPRLLAKVYRQTTLIGGTCVIAASLVLLPVFRWMLTCFWPADYVEPVWTCVLIIMPGMWVMGFSVVNDAFYLVTNQLKVGILISSIAFICLIPVLFLLAQLMPEKGVAIAMSFAYATSSAHVIYAFIWLRRRQGSLVSENISQPAS